LIVWPIEISPGAWLPPIWGVRGWKVAAKIATNELYDRFIVLVIGLLQELQRRLSAFPRGRTFVLDLDSRLVSPRYFAGSAWATGFMTGLFQNSAGLQSRSSAVRSAVETIASYASLRSQQSSAMPAAAASLQRAVGVLMDERPSTKPIKPVPLSEGLMGGRARAGFPKVA
jgi:Uncharacterised protein family (UPF0149)